MWGETWDTRLMLQGVWVVADVASIAVCHAQRYGMRRKTISKLSDRLGWSSCRRHLTYRKACRLLEPLLISAECMLKAIAA